VSCIGHFLEMYVFGKVEATDLLSMKSLLRKQRQLLDPGEFDIPPITGDPAYKAAALEVAQLKQRLAETEKRRERAINFARAGAPATISTGAADVEKAETKRKSRVAALLSGGTVLALDPQRELQAVEAEERDLLAGLYDAQARLNDVVATLSHEMALRYAESHNESLRAAMDAIAALHDAVDCMFSLRARLMAAGYRVNSINVPLPPLQIDYFGDAQRFGTAAWYYRAWLEKLGVL
jgi:hypothetical protein